MTTAEVLCTIAVSLSAGVTVRAVLALREMKRIRASLDSLRRELGR